MCLKQDLRDLQDERLKQDSQDEQDGQDERLKQDSQDEQEKRSSLRVLPLA